MKNSITLLCGILFGFGLAYSDMINPQTVINFLTFKDFGLLLVLGFAVGINLIAYQFIAKKMKKPVLAPSFESRGFKLSKSAITGGVLFGLGWGITGVCPAPAITGLGAGNWQMLIMLVFIFLGAALHGLYASNCDKKQGN